MPSPRRPAAPRPSRCSGRRMPSSRPPGRSARAVWPRCSRTWSAPRGMAMWLGRVTSLSTYAARRRPRSITFGRRRKAGRMANAMTVLVVDDDAVSSAQLGALAKATGYDVKSAYNGREAWELLQLARIPIVISDWYMPEMDGPELCRRIRSRVREPYVYFILVTARGGKQQYLAGMEAGADDFIAKPMDPDELGARLKVAEGILGLRQETEQHGGLPPMVAEMIMESLFAVWDVYWVGRVGPAAQATVGLTESLLTLIYTAAMGLSIGVTAMVARRIGEKNLAGAAEAAVQGIALGVIVALMTGAIGVAFAPRLLARLGARPEVLPIGRPYARFMLGGDVVMLLLFLINAVFRGAGDAAIAMRVLWLANSINILLGPCLILGLGPFPRLGVTGAAIATTIGRGTGVLYQLYRLWRGDARVSIRRAQLTLQPAVMRTMLRLSGTGTFQVLIGTASWIFLVRKIG